MRLYAPQALVDSGLLKHILPRFSLKTQVRVELESDPGAANLRLGAEGRPVFDGLGQTWHVEVVSSEHKGTLRFVDWLGSKVGRKTARSVGLSLYPF